MDDERIIGAAREGFDDRLHGEEYRRVHSDAEHLENLLALFEIRDGASYLDLGTGNGYVALELAKRHPGIHVAGLDIAAASIAQDAEIARDLGLANLDFLPYDGRTFPFDDGSLFGCASRYALHHFPDIRASLAEIRRVVMKGGFFILSDPRTLDEDALGLIDKLQALRPDGHVHFYRRSEIEALFGEFGFASEKEFASSVRYPRTMDGRYRRLLHDRGEELARMYGIEVDGEHLFIRTQVMNIFFRRER
jgi:ubiquinone/menaquinone biosynthesis C-methylase UbiE